MTEPRTISYAAVAKNAIRCPVDQVKPTQTAPSKIANEPNANDSRNGFLHDHLVPVENVKTTVENLTAPHDSSSKTWAALFRGDTAIPAKHKAPSVKKDAVIPLPTKLNISGKNMNKRAVEKESPIEKNVPLNGWPQSLKAVCENDVPALQQKKGLNGTTNERTDLLDTSTDLRDDVASSVAKADLEWKANGPEQRNRTNHIGRATLDRGRNGAGRRSNGNGGRSSGNRYGNTSARFAPTTPFFSPNGTMSMNYQEMTLPTMFISTPPPLYLPIGPPPHHQLLLPPPPPQPVPPVGSLPHSSIPQPVICNSLPPTQHGPTSSVPVFNVPPPTAQFIPPHPQQPFPMYPCGVRPHSSYHAPSTVHMMHPTHQMLPHRGTHSAIIPSMYGPPPPQPTFLAPMLAQRQQQQQIMMRMNNDISQMGTAASTSICGAGMILNSPRPNAASAAAAAADSVMPSVEAKPEVVRPPLTAHSTPHKQHLDGWSNAVEKMDHDNRIRVKIGLVINDRYQVVSKVNVGSYGAIYSALDLKDNSTQVAIKFETGTSDSHLRTESEVYKSLGGKVESICASSSSSVTSTTTQVSENKSRSRHPPKDVAGVPSIYWIGEQHTYNIMVMELLGPSLENLFSYCSNRLRKETVHEIGMQMLARVEHLHNRGFIHRDLKPENFLMGLGLHENTCYLIDFGLARRYRFRDGTSKSFKHIPYRQGKNLVGTARYASLNSHNGYELSRRDDLESIAYILLEFVNGELPWKLDRNRAQARVRSKLQSYNRIKTMKESLDWSAVSGALDKWMIYVRQLEFETAPDYSLLRSYLDEYLNEATPQRLDQLSKTPAGDGDNREDTQRLCKSMKGVSLSGARRQQSIRRNERDAGRRSGASTMNTAGSSSMDANSAKQQQPQAVSSDGTNGGAAAADGEKKMKRFDWLERRDNSPNARYNYECLFRWTLPHGSQPIVPTNTKPSMNFGYGFGEGGFA